MRKRRRERQSECDVEVKLGRRERQTMEGSEHERGREWGRENSYRGTICYEFV